MNSIAYIPNSNLTIEEVLTRAIKMSNNGDVFAYVNDIKITVKRTSNKEKLLAEYHKKLTQKYKKLQKARQR